MLSAFNMSESTIDICADFILSIQINKYRDSNNDNANAIADIVIAKRDDNYLDCFELQFDGIKTLTIDK